MNIIEGVVQGLNPADGMCEVEIRTELGLLYSIVLEYPRGADFVRENKRVKCIFKETDAEILKENVHNLNTFEGRVKAVHRGSLLSLLKVDCKGKVLELMLTTRQIDAIGVKEGDRVYVFLSPIRVVLESGDE